MRKLKLQVQMSVDGFISGLNNEMDWMTFNWSDDIKKYVDEITKPVDTILLGKNLAMGFIPHWAAEQLPTTRIIPNKKQVLSTHRHLKLCLAKP